ncbi:MAG: translation initiation factor IF-2 [Pseudomonadota bacterium]|uniref:Translation initiation factor IF-2 n=1 Tax=Candidatus Desulfatibia profunda TaxID=2841695 RepID=A0A8J6NSG3_9BACT|nr:translation initiation factor IF-2 [Candidatus Desulfatibia profunda]MBL7179609.1 translation initiation factor IF-2 [Desulfobacterales bacterium]
MAKIRVYELARNFNMTNKALLEKMREIAIPVKSHMSALDDDIVARIKQNILGFKEKDVEETRIKPTIIRRRHKRVPEEPVEVEAVAEPQVRPEKTEAAQEPIEESVAAKQPPFKKEPQATARAAKIEAKAIKKADMAEMVVEKKKVAEKDAPKIIDVPDGVDSPTVIQKERQQVVPPAVLKQKRQPVAKKVKPKKIKKEIPAKIIRLPAKPPDEVIIPVVDKAKDTPPEPVVTKIPLPVELDHDDTAPPEEVPAKKKKKRAKRPEDTVIDKKFFKKKISFRKKEVVEGEDLYAPSQRVRKIRKTTKAKAAVIQQKPQITIPKAIKRRIKIDDTIALSDLAKRMGIKAAEIIKKLMGLNVMATVNQIIDFDTAVLVASEFDYELEKASFEEETLIRVEQDDPSKLIERPPVVTVMGHVDHGKTSLLDVIRKTKVTENEAGGITQHIGAYHVSTEKGQIIFLDTPGHEAFTEMRARGAKVTDLVVLVVAADDGVMPQTIEAINHAKAAGVPIIVAINKIDKANADPERVQRELADAGLVPEEWGGETIFVKVSAKENTGIDDLLEMILLQAEILELKANPDRLAMGHVVEAKLDSGRGPVATVLIRQGTLKVHDPVVCGVHHGKVRALLNDRGVQVASAGPSMPAEIIGLTGVPNAGDEMIALADEKDAKQVSAHRIQKQRSKELAKTGRLSLEKLYEQMQVGKVKELNIILKADVHGSIEALRDSLTKLSNEEVKINVIHAATGTLTESDVSLSAVSDAIIIGFNVRPSSKVQALASEENVDTRFYNIIYDVIKDIKNAIIGMMSSTFEERVLGRAEVREVFHVPKVGAISGCYVTEGKVERGRKVRILRDWVVLYDGTISSLRRFKDDAKEVQSGYECGIGIENYNDIKIGDIIECYYLEEIRPELEQ